MRVYGIDFTSAPSARKPIVVAQCELEDDVLAVHDLLRLSSFVQLERCLATPGAWIAGVDLPLGLPRELITGLRWPEDWTEVVERAGALPRDEFRDLVDMWKGARPQGDKEAWRTTDRIARAQPPTKLVRPPLALMFHAGAPRIAAAGACVLPCRECRAPRIVVESYPALVARALSGGERHAYKDDASRRSTAAQANTRQELVERLRGDTLRDRYGLVVRIGTFMSDGLVADAGGDLLDGVLAAVQAAWSFSQRDEGFGIPEGVDRLEGWIVDPETRRGWQDLRSAT